MKKRKLIFKKEYNVWGNYWKVYNTRKEWLGNVSYDTDWKCYVWRQDQEVLMSPDCLIILANKMLKLKSK